MKEGAYMIFKLLQTMKKNLIFSIIIAMVIGLVIGYYVDVSILKKAITPLTFLMVYPMLVPLKLESLTEKGNIKLQIATIIINFAVLPFVAYTLGLVFFRDNNAFRLGLLMMSLLPTSGMTISWTVMAKGNVSEAIRMVVLGLLVGAMLIPLYISGLLGEAISVDFWNVFSKVAIPLFFAFITQIVLKKQYGNETFNKSIKPKFPLFSILAVVLMIFVATSLRAKTLIDNPMILVEIIVPLLSFYGIVFGIQYYVGKLFFETKERIALSNGTIVRNLSVALSLIFGAFGNLGLAALLIAIAYVIQVQFAAWNTRLAEKIY